MKELKDKRMSWTCPYQINNECVRLRKMCQPSQEGCVLKGKVTFTGNQLYNAHKINLKKGDDKDDKVRSNCRI
jgi:hypothetical protein